VIQRASARRFHTRALIALFEAQQRLRRAQPLDDAIAEQLLDQSAASGADTLGLLQAPIAIMSEEGLRLRGQMIA
jgi:hypothetical protein